MEDLQQELAVWKERAYKAEQERDALIISIQAIIIRASEEKQPSYRHEGEQPNERWAELDDTQPDPRFNLEG